MTFLNDLPSREVKQYCHRVGNRDRINVGVRRADCSNWGGVLTDRLATEEIGLTLREGKDVLKRVQRNIVQTQIQVQSMGSSRCVYCSGRQHVNDIRTLQMRTVFGKIARQRPYSAIQSR
jgi:hypothetical protein